MGALRESRAPRIESKRVAGKTFMRLRGPQALKDTKVYPALGHEASRNWKFLQVHGYWPISNLRSRVPTVLISQGLRGVHNRGN